ncbi:MAG TPA: hypothetical protein VIM57_04545 [Luteolibacter sp.]
MSQNPARAFSLVFLSLALPSLRAADTLTEADREILIEKLKKIENAADEKMDQRFRVAVSAFRAGMASDEAAIELYLKCVEKIEFEDEHKKGQDFRDWKRKEDAKLGSIAFRRALRHQLRWLVLTLQVASKSSDITAFGPEASKLVDEVFDDIKSLDGQQSVMKENVVGTVFAQAYNLTDVAPKDWPMSPVNLSEIYQKVILPPLRKPEKTDQLRSAWMKRIRQEVASREDWVKTDKKDDKEKGKEEDENHRIGTKDALRTPETEKFLSNTYPELLWQMEVDVFKAGDQRGASLRMLQHLEKYTAHPKAPDWAKEFHILLDPEAAISLPGSVIPQPPANTPPAGTPPPAAKP